MVSDFVDGQILSKFVATQPRKRLSCFEALHLFYALTEGVEKIHYLGEYHGDIHTDNIMVKRKGLGFEIFLVDFFDLGRSTKDKIQSDVYDLIAVLYELAGGAKGYAKADPRIRRIIKGRKRGLISKQYKNARQLRLALENLDWSFS